MAGGAGGRPRKPSALKLLTGTFRKDRAPKREPKPKAEKHIPAPPSFLGRVAKEEWRRVTPELYRLGLLTKVDRASLAGYCQSYARWIECEKVVTEMGVTFMTEKGYVCQRPEVSIAQKERALMRQFANDFGLNPSSRSRIDTPEPEKPKDQDEDFLFGAKGARAG